MRRSHLIIGIALLLTPVLLIGQSATSTKPMHMPEASGQMPADCQAMMQKMQSMHASAKAMDDRLASLVSEMNKAKGSAKVDRMAAVINELVTQRKQMRDDMEAMMPQMMQHSMQHMQSGMTGGMQSMANCPMMKGSTAGSDAHAGHHAAMMERGAKGMGFSQEKTTHHFVLLDTGGRIEVTANDPKDSESVNAIRGHLQHIAMAFSKGDFQLPMLIHDQTPPGVAEMKRLQSGIAYRYEELPAGGRVVITTSDPAARDAVHEFLRFQIKDHGTGDPSTVFK